MTEKVEAGFFSFTEVTDPSEHRAYNEWHQLDHMPQQYEIAGIVHGQRWVSTPACRAARAFVSEQLAAIHYMTLYLMSAPFDRTLEDFKALGGELRGARRFHEHRRSRLSGPFALVDMRVAPRILVSADVVPFRPNLGAYVIVDEMDEAEPRDAGEHETFELVGQPGVAGVWSFRSSSGFEHLGWSPGHRRITVCYLDEPPLEVSAELGDAVRTLRRGGRDPQFAGPLETVTPFEWDWFESP